MEAALEAKLRGPHSFPLERLLHIFYVIFAHHDAEEEKAQEEEEPEEGGSAGGGTSEAQREVCCGMRVPRALLAGSPAVRPCWRAAHLRRMLRGRQRLPRPCLCAIVPRASAGLCVLPALTPPLPPASVFPPQTRRVMQQAEVLYQVCSLVTLRLLDQCSGDVLDGQLYRCNLGEDMAQALAANVRLTLTDYLRLD